MDYLTLDIFGNNSSRSEAALSLAVIIFPSWWPITGERINLLTIIGTQSSMGKEIIIFKILIVSSLFSMYGLLNP